MASAADVETTHEGSGQQGIAVHGLPAYGLPAYRVGAIWQDKKTIIVHDLLPEQILLPPASNPSSVEADSAAVSKIEELLAGGQQAMEDLIFRCSGDIPIEVLRRKGFGNQLRRNLSMYLGVDLWAQEHADLASRLGKAKYHLYTPGARFNKRKPREEAAEAAAAAAVARIQSSVSDYLDENLAARIDEKVEDWLCGGSVAETESLCSESGAARCSTSSAPLAPSHAEPR